eukprot:5304943-Amphidinium_carterae.1
MTMNSTCNGQPRSHPTSGHCIAVAIRKVSQALFKLPPLSSHCLFRCISALSAAEARIAIESRIGASRPHKAETANSQQEIQLEKTTNLHKYSTEAKLKFCEPHRALSLDLPLRICCFGKPLFLVRRPLTSLRSGQTRDAAEQAEYLVQGHAQIKERGQTQ